MAIVSIRKGYSGHAAGGTFDKKTATVRFSLITDDVTDDAFFTWPQTDPIDGTTVIPAAGTLYPGRLDIRASYPQVKRVSPTFFNIEVKYKSTILENGEEDPSEDFAANPLSMPAKETGRTVVSTVPMFQDINGVPFVNRLGEPYLGLTQDFADQSLTLTRNEASFSLGDANNLFRTICGGEFRGVAEGRVLMNDISWEHVKDEVSDSASFGDILYTKVTYEIFFRLLDRPLINAYELKRDGVGLLWQAINNPDLADKYAWYYRYVYTGKQHVDSNDVYIYFEDGQDHNIKVSDSTKVPIKQIPDFIFQQKYKVKTWNGIV